MGSLGGLVNYKVHKAINLPYYKGECYEWKIAQELGGCKFLKDTLIDPFDEAIGLYEGHEALIARMWVWDPMGKFKDHNILYIVNLDKW